MADWLCYWGSCYRNRLGSSGRLGLIVQCLKLAMLTVCSMLLLTRNRLSCLWSGASSIVRVVLVTTLGAW